MVGKEKETNVLYTVGSVLWVRGYDTFATVIEVKHDGTIRLKPVDDASNMVINATVDQLSEQPENKGTLKLSKFGIPEGW